MLKSLSLILFILGINNGQCPSSDELCQVCEGSVCNFCVYSQPDNQGVCQPPVKVIDGCYSYIKEGVCQECDEGYYQDTNGGCYKLTNKNAEHCFMSLISTSSCSHCKNSTLTTNGKCPSKRKCTDSNCEICSMWGSSESCNVCMPNFVLIGPTYRMAKCVRSNEKLSGCYYSNSTSFCKDCDIGFYFSDNECKPTTIMTMSVQRLMSFFTLAYFFF